MKALRIVAIASDKSLSGFDFNYSHINTIADVCWVSGALEAEDFITTNSTVAVVIDLKVGDKSGFEIAKKLRSRIGDRIPIIVLVSGHGLRGIIGGNTTKLTAPFDQEGFEAYLLGLLDHFKKHNFKMMSLQNYVDAMPYMAMIMDKDHRVLAGNSIYRKFPLTKKGCMLNCFSVVHETVEAPFGCPLQQAVDTKKNAVSQLTDSSLGKIQVSISPIKFPGVEDLVYLHIAHQLPE